VLEKKDGKPAIKTHVSGSDQLFTPEEISAKILEKLKGDAERCLQHKIIYAVITVPSYFDDTQRQATKDAATLAGINTQTWARVIRIDSGTLLNKYSTQSENNK
jgi:molecular chaperone DnaK (HSP70)